MTTLSAGVRFHEVVHGVYFDDLDAFQILHNARYLLLVERTIGAFLRELGWANPLDAHREADAFHLVRANHIEYHRAVEGIGEVRVRVWVEKVGSTSITFGFCVMPMNQELDCASGTRVLVRVDPKLRTPLPWTEETRTQVKPFTRP